MLDRLQHIHPDLIEMFRLPMVAMDCGVWRLTFSQRQESLHQHIDTFDRRTCLGRYFRLRQSVRHVVSGAVLPHLPLSIMICSEAATLATFAGVNWATCSIPKFHRW